MLDFIGFLSSGCTCKVPDLDVQSGTEESLNLISTKSTIISIAVANIRTLKILIIC